jgi:hypothetical protein
LERSAYEELHNINTSPYTNTIIKSRRMRLVGHVESMGEAMNSYRILVEEPEGDRLLLLLLLPPRYK